MRLSQLKRQIEELQDQYNQAEAVLHSEMHRVLSGVLIDFEGKCPFDVVLQDWSINDGYPSFAIGFDLLDDSNPIFGQYPFSLMTGVERDEFNSETEMCVCLTQLFSEAYPDVASSLDGTCVKVSEIFSKINPILKSLDVKIIKELYENDDWE